MAFEEFRQRQSAVPGGAPAEQPLRPGDEAHVHELLGDAFDLDLEEYVSTFFFATNYRSDGEIVHTRDYLFVRGRRR